MASTSRSWRWRASRFVSRASAWTLAIVFLLWRFALDAAAIAVGNTVRDDAGRVGGLRPAELYYGLRKPNLLYWAVVTTTIWIVSSWIHAKLKDESLPQRQVFETGIGWQRFPYGGALRWLWALGGFFAVKAVLSVAAVPLASGAWVLAIPGLLVFAGWAAVGILGGSLQHTVLGDDGIRIERPWRSRFVGFSHVRRIWVKWGSATVKLHTGKKLYLGPRLAAAVAARLRAGLVSYRKREGHQLSVDQQEALSRGTSTAAEWKRRIAGFSHARGYRTESVAIEELENVLSDPRCAPEHRVAAALTLPKTDEREELLRVAIDGSADLDLRAALEAAAEGELVADRVARAQRRFSG